MTTNECIICLEGCVAPRCKFSWQSLYNRQQITTQTIVLSSAYKCDCKATAHKICLHRVLKCPTCREQISPYQLDTNLYYNIQDTELDCFIKDNYPSYYHNFIGSLKKKDDNAIVLLFSIIQYFRQVDWQFCMICYFVVVFGLFIVINNQFSCAPQIELCLRKNANNACYSCSLRINSQNTDTDTNINSSDSNREGLNFAITLSFVLSSITFISVWTIVTFAYFVNLVLIRATLLFFYLLIYASHKIIVG